MNGYYPLGGYFVDLRRSMNERIRTRKRKIICRRKLEWIFLWFLFLPKWTLQYYKKCNIGSPFGRWFLEAEQYSREHDRRKLEAHESSLVSRVFLEVTWTWLHWGNARDATQGHGSWDVCPLTLAPSWPNLLFFWNFLLSKMSRHWEKSGKKASEPCKHLRGKP